MCNMYIRYAFPVIILFFESWAWGESGNGNQMGSLCFVRSYGMGVQSLAAFSFPREFASLFFCFLLAVGMDDGFIPRR
ncbi:hypothetical protein B0H67DRAFT_583791 [Lasiosphaeris hirsuta]|uniref:Uncharacterized protein n=1 Tax=Lasiosphaeris hirsuta TaxID=260670 RepID=A0AA40A7V2_9PEZI|nr:hypothetical protein B0H67DRAFT_583791 [Lasiosphaeris hirsuta]